MLQVGAILLNMTPASSNVLLSATKMLYGLSKDSSNDSRFRHHGVLRPLLQMAAGLSTVLEQQQQQQQQPHVNTALLYCSGCLKNVSADATNQKSLGRLGGVATMAQVRLLLTPLFTFDLLHDSIGHAWTWHVIGVQRAVPFKKRRLLLDLASQAAITVLTASASAVHPSHPCTGCWSRVRPRQTTSGSVC